VVRLVSKDDLARPNTDDLNPLEFGFARGVTAGGSLDVEQMQITAAMVGARWPRVDGPVDWEVVLDEQVALATSQGVAPSPSPLPSLSPLRTALSRAQTAYLADDLEGSLRLWRQVGREPRNLTELVMVAESLAQAGQPAARDLAERLRAFNPIEADLVLARLHYRLGEIDQASALLQAAFIKHRSDPWPAPFVVKRALTMARDLAKTHTRHAERLYLALAAPFAVMSLEEDRREAALSVSLAGARRYCVAAFAVYEPHLPWREVFLERRRDCYRALGHPLAARAAADLEEFLAGEPVAPF
jgi:hypothetical protein